MNLRTRLFATVAILAWLPAMAIEEPEFEVLHSTANYEVRAYEPYIVAEVDVTGETGRAGNSAFRVLAGYIFGGNEPGEKMAMTAPVASEPLPDGEAYTYAFVMERKYDMASLPKPLDPRIRLVEKPARVMAVRRYSGSWNPVTDRDQRAALIAALDTDEIATRGEPIMARYDSPWTPGFMRRNEVMIEVAWAEPAD